MQLRVRKGHRDRGHLPSVALIGKVVASAKSALAAVVVARHIVTSVSLAQRLGL